MLQAKAASKTAKKIMKKTAPICHILCVTAQGIDPPRDMHRISAGNLCRDRRNPAHQTRQRQTLSLVRSPAIPRVTCANLRLEEACPQPRTNLQLPRVKLQLARAARGFLMNRAATSGAPSRVRQARGLAQNRQARGPVQILTGPRTHGLMMSQRAGQDPLRFPPRLRCTTRP